MKKHLTALTLTSLCVGSISARQPNIIMFMVDDLGLYDTHCYGFDAVDTPNVDKLAKDGMLFSKAYAGSTVCSPSRAAVITGQSPARNHFTNHISYKSYAPENAKLIEAKTLTDLPNEAVTYAEKLRDAGYIGAHFGKWHISHTKPWPNPTREVVDENTLPDAQGFAHNFGGNGSGGPGEWFSPYKNKYLSDGPDGEYLPYRLANEAEKFIRANKDKPFLVNFWCYNVHSPLKTTNELVEKYMAKRKAGEKMSSPVYSGMIEAMDQTLGKILDTVEELGLEDDTFVIFTSDNGGINKLTNEQVLNLREGKGYLFEGGIRVPMIIKWPGKIKPGTVNDEKISHLDVFPTLLEVAGIEKDSSLTLDGESLVPLLKQEGKLKRTANFFHYPNYAWHGKNRLGGAIIERDFKLINWYDDDSVELYNLKTDPTETKNIAAQNPELADQMKRKFKKWLIDVDANMPTENPEYIAPN